MALPQVVLSSEGEASSRRLSTNHTNLLKPGVGR